MTEYQLPEPAIHAPFYKECKTVYQGDYFTAEQMQAAYAAGREAAMTPLIDRLVILHIYRKEHETDTALAIKEMVDWEIQIALDPQVSSDAQALIDRGRESMDGLVSTVGTLLAVIDSGLVDITPDLVAVMRVREQLEELK